MHTIPHFEDIHVEVIPRHTVYYNALTADQWVKQQYIERNILQTLIQI